jgi:hypothetical protein
MEKLFTFRARFTSNKILPVEHREQQIGMFMPSLDIGKLDPPLASVFSSTQNLHL